jgi:hypothetical protein
VSSPKPLDTGDRDQRMAPRIAEILEQNGYYCLYLSAGWYRTNFPEIDDPVMLESGHTLCMPAGGELKEQSDTAISNRVAQRTGEKQEVSMQYRLDMKLALALIIVIVLALWLIVPLNTWIAGLLIGLALYGIIRLWSA